MKTRIAALLLSLSAPVFAAAPTDAAPPPPPTPAVELKQLEPFTGAYTCTGRAPASPAGPAHEYKARLEIKTALGGFWVAEKYEQVRTKAHPMAQAFDAFVTWDQGSKRFQRIGADNIGAWENATSAGVEGNKMVYAGELLNFMGQPKVPYRFTLLKKTDKELEIILEAPLGPQGAFIPLADETCVR